MEIIVLSMKNIMPMYARAARTLRKHKQLCCIAIILSTLTITALFANSTATPQLAIQPYDEVFFAASYRCFGDELYAIRRNGLIGYMDRNGHVVIAPQYEDGASHFSENLAYVRVGRYFGYIDKYNNTIIAASFDKASDFREGMAHVSVDGKYGFIDRTGRVVISMQFDFASPFIGGIACVGADVKSPTWKDKLSNTRRFDYYYVNSSGERVANTAPRLRAVSDSLLRVWRQGRVGFMDLSGNVVIEPQYENAGLFSNGLAPVKRTGQRWCYINLLGEEIIEPRFDWARTFYGSLAEVVICGDRFYIDRDGRLICGEQFE